MQIFSCSFIFLKHNCSDLFTSSRVIDAESPIVCFCLGWGGGGGWTNCLFLVYSNLFHSILFYSILFYSILFYSILFYSILFYSILFYSILFYSILFYSSLFYSILLCSILSITFFLFYIALFLLYSLYSFLNIVYMYIRLSHSSFVLQLLIVLNVFFSWCLYSFPLSILLHTVTYFSSSMMFKFIILRSILFKMMIIKDNNMRDTS